MPPANKFSRDAFCLAVPDANGVLFLTEREPFRYVDLDDNIEHIVTAGDTWTSLAAKYYSSLPSPELLYWAIADFQPGIILDPTIRIEPGTRLYIPSQRTLEEDILSESRRAITQA